MSGAQIASRAGDAAEGSAIRGRLDGSGETLARLLHPLWPVRTWPVYVPGGSRVRGVVQAAQRAQLARVEQGRLALAAPWLPEPVSLLPVGLYITGLRLRLPPPG